MPIQLPIAAGPQGFDFEVGEWRVHHRIKRPTGEWYEFEGTCSMRPLMAGAANVEEHVFARPTGTTYGVAVRAYDAEKKHWSIWWVDSRYMSLMGEPAIGRFENGVGNFYSDYTDPQGKTVRGRSTGRRSRRRRRAGSSRQSTDGGKTWEPNWIMELAGQPKLRKAKQKNPRGRAPAGVAGVPQLLPWGQLLAAMRRPEPGGTAVNVTSWPAVAAIARSVESAMFGLPSSGSQVPLATS